MRRDATVMHDPDSVTHDHWVYLCHDQDGTLLYVGVTSKGLERFRSGHSKTAPWWPEVASINIEHLSSRNDALRRELVLIDSLKPLHNIVGVEAGPSFGADEFLGDVPDPDTMPTNWLRLGQLAGWLQVDTDSVIAWMETGMPHMLLSGRPRFCASEVRDWLERSHN